MYLERLACAIVGMFHCDARSPFAFCPFVFPRPARAMIVCLCECVVLLFLRSFSFICSFFLLVASICYLFSVRL